MSQDDAPESQHPESAPAMHESAMCLTPQNAPENPPLLSTGMSGGLTKLDIGSALITPTCTPAASPDTTPHVSPSTNRYPNKIPEVPCVQRTGVAPGALDLLRSLQALTAMRTLEASASIKRPLFPEKSGSDSSESQTVDSTEEAVSHTASSGSRAAPAHQPKRVKFSESTPPQNKRTRSEITVKSVFMPMNELYNRYIKDAALRDPRLAHNFEMMIEGGKINKLLCTLIEDFSPHRNSDIGFMVPKREGVKRENANLALILLERWESTEESKAGSPPPAFYIAYVFKGILSGELHAQVTRSMLGKKVFYVILDAERISVSCGFDSVGLPTLMRVSGDDPSQFEFDSGVLRRAFN